MFRLLPPLAALAVLSMAPVLARAQSGLHDPTLPPPGYQPVVPAEKSAAIEKPLPVVPSVQIKRLDAGSAAATGRRSTASEASAPARVISVSAEGVVVQSGGSKQTMPAGSAVKKKVISDK